MCYNNSILNQIGALPLKYLQTFVIFEIWDWVDGFAALRMHYQMKGALKGVFLKNYPLLQREEFRISL